jgi:hypothetical protein
MKGWVLAFAVALNITLACQNESPPPTPSPSPSPGVWLHGSKSVASRVAESSHGSAHCGYQDSIFLIIGWPLGHAEQDSQLSRWYVRNPVGEWRTLTLSEFTSNVTPPRDAKYTGYYNSSYELWLAPSDQDVAAYIKTGGHFERWPRAKQPVFCV